MEESGSCGSVVNALVAFARSFDPARVDEQTEYWAKHCILDLFGCMLAAASPRFSIAPILEAFVTDQGGTPVSSLVGRDLRTGPTLAALFNGTLGYYCDNEPRFAVGIIHPVAVVVPAAMAVGEARNATGRRVWGAIVLGVDVACRMSLALDPMSLYARGFHPTSVAGVFGAAAAGAYLLELDDQRWRNALGLAGQQSGGLLAWVDDHTEHSRPLNPGLAARNGVTAASLAALGLGGPPDPLEGKYNIFTAFSGVSRPEHLTEARGSKFYIGELSPKRHASVGFTHSGLDALAELMQSESLTIEDLESVDVHIPRSGARLVDNSKLKSHNAQYILAVGALKGRVTIDDILGDPVDHPEVMRLKQRTTVVYDQELEDAYAQRYSSLVVVRTRDGRALKRRVDFPKGFPQNPMSEAEWNDKFMEMASRQCNREQACRIMGLTLRMDQLEDIRELGDALSLRG